MKKKLQLIWIFIFGVIMLLGLCYIGLAIYYENGFSYGTYINGVYCTGKTIEEVNTELNQNFVYHGLKVTTLYDEFTIDGKDIDFTYDFMEPLQIYQKRQNPYLWIENLFHQKNGVTLLPKGVYDKEKAKSYALESLQKELQMKPQVFMELTPDGYVLHDSKKNVLNQELTLKEICSALLESKSSLNLKNTNCYEKKAYTEKEENIIALFEKTDAFQNREIEIDFDGEKLVFNKVELSSLLLVDENKLPVLTGSGVLQINEEKAKDFLQDAYSPYNSYHNHYFHTYDGTEIYINSGNYGNEIDMKNEWEWFLNCLDSDIAISHSPVYLREVQKKGRDDIGNTYIEIDVTNQHLYYFKDGVVAIETDVVTGNTGRKRGTPQMVCSVYAKQEKRVLKGPGYASFVNYWMPVSGNIGIHDAPWREKYGGEIYKTGGSHGCINTPYDNMKKLYDSVEIGTPVIIYYRE